MVPDRILGVDPGREKCGLAVLDQTGAILARRVVATADLLNEARELVREHLPDRIAMGDGTGSRALRTQVQSLGLPLDLVAEHHTTERARERYYRDHGPLWWQRFLPPGLRVPPVPVDDYAAVLIAEAAFAKLG